MLTLKELKKIVKVADVEKRIPSVKSLKEHKVVVKEMINADTTISVYDVKELYAPDGFVTNDEEKEFTFEYAGEEQPTVTYDFTFENQPKAVA